MKYLQLLKTQKKSKPSQLSNIKDSLVAWYDFDDLTDSHSSHNLTIGAGSPVFENGFVDTDSSNYLVIPGAMLTYVGGVWVPDTNTDGTFLLCFQSRGAFSSGGDFFDHGSTTYLRYTATDGFVASIKGSNQNYNSPNINTPYIVGATYNSSTDTIELIINGKGSGTASSGYSESASSADLGHGQNSRLYWMGFWNRILNKTEIAALYSAGTSLRYGRVVKSEIAITNGSFEDDATGWTLSGNVQVVDENENSIYEPTNGTKLAVYNGGTVTPNGVMAQDITTVNGVTYTLTFDVGIVAWHTRTYKLGIVVDGNAPNLLSVTESVTGTDNGNNVWRSVSHNFTADGATSTVKFSDLTDVSNEAGDLLLDNITLTQTP